MKVSETCSDRITSSKPNTESKIVFTREKTGRRKPVFRGNPYLKEASIQRKFVFRGNMYSDEIRILAYFTQLSYFFLTDFRRFPSLQYTAWTYEKCAWNKKWLHATIFNFCQVHGYYTREKESTTTSWDGEEYELSVTSNKRRLFGKSKNLQFYNKVMSF